MTEVIDPISGYTTYRYDIFGNQTLVIDPDGNLTTFVYDEDDQKIEEQDPNGGDVTYLYDDLGLVTSMTEKIDATHSRSTTTSYDDDGEETNQWMTPAGVW